MRSPADKIAEFMKVAENEMKALQDAADEIVWALLQMVKEDTDEKTS